ncbi:hypothetical protein E4U60_000333 [Claviceps pazoutovae]|uniref:Uncharacterized protein n=1 Tax=Claviceps pazoutovae TaxID=1649127 RepID=A0A9P7SIQ4_9HYPO|nr:hypothetical protein E4U60_000333 [Claviceps pazoutovae]
MTREAAQAYAERIYEAWEVAKRNMTRAQARQAEEANRKRREVDFDINRQGWMLDRPSEKLNNPWAGPYEIVGSTTSHQRRTRWTARFDIKCNIY